LALRFLCKNTRRELMGLLDYELDDDDEFNNYYEVLTKSHQSKYNQIVDDLVLRAEVSILPGDRETERMVMNPDLAAETYRKCYFPFIKYNFHIDVRVAMLIGAPGEEYRGWLSGKCYQLVKPGISGEDVSLDYDSKIYRQLRFKDLYHLAQTCVRNRDLIHSFLVLRMKMFIRVYDKYKDFFGLPNCLYFDDKEIDYKEYCLNISLNPHMLAKYHSRKGTSLDNAMWLVDHFNTRSRFRSTALSVFKNYKSSRDFVRSCSYSVVCLYLIEIDLSIELYTYSIGGGTQDFQIAFPVYDLVGRGRYEDFQEVSILSLAKSFSSNPLIKQFLELSGTDEYRGHRFLVYLLRFFMRLTDDMDIVKYFAEVVVQYIPLFGLHPLVEKHSLFELGVVVDPEQEVCGYLDDYTTFGNVENHELAWGTVFHRGVT